MNEEQTPLRFTWHVWALVFFIVALFLRTASTFYTENFEAEAYALRISESDFDRYTPERFQEMKAQAALLKSLNEMPLLDLLLPDAWSKMQVLPKKIWVERMKAKQKNEMRLP